MSFLRGSDGLVDPIPTVSFPELEYVGDRVTPSSASRTSPPRHPTRDTDPFTCVPPTVTPPRFLQGPLPGFQVVTSVRGEDSGDTTKTVGRVTPEPVRRRPEWRDPGVSLRESSRPPSPNLRSPPLTSRPENPRLFKGTRVTLRRHPFLQGRESGFHLLSGTRPTSESVSY